MSQDTREFLEKLKSTVGVAGELAQQGLDAAGKAAVEAWDTAKLRWKKAEVQGDVQRLYREVGRLIYKAHTDKEAQTDGLDDLFAALDEKTAQVEAYKQELRARRGEALCTTCGAKIGDGDAFCRRCGEKIKPKTEETTGDGGGV
ncbi:MAG: zinc ribbon domain-containing protein [Oscillospiraceae bacterium]|jgi:ribosomal protein L40E|nr:zinc ribbon domain-containing protein [Oscillospiraceae bacterium]